MHAMLILFAHPVQALLHIARRLREQPEANLPPLLPTGPGDGPAKGHDCKSLWANTGSLSGLSCVPLQKGSTHCLQGHIPDCQVPAGFPIKAQHLKGEIGSTFALLDACPAACDT